MKCRISNTAANCSGNSFRLRTSSRLMRHWLMSFSNILLSSANITKSRRKNICLCWFPNWSAVSLTSILISMIRNSHWVKCYRRLRRWRGLQAASITVEACHSPYSGVSTVRKINSYVLHVLTTAIMVMLLHLSIQQSMVVSMAVTVLALPRTHVSWRSREKSRYPISGWFVEGIWVVLTTCHQYTTN